MSPCRRPVSIVKMPIGAPVAQDRVGQHHVLGGQAARERGGRMSRADLRERELERVRAVEEPGVAPGGKRRRHAAAAASRRRKSGSGSSTVPW